MAATGTSKQWTISGMSRGFDELAFDDSASIPKLEDDHSVLVRLRGASLNFRDLLIPKGDFPYPVNLPLVPASDGAGEVVEVGAKVRAWKKGDRVVTVFNRNHQHGPGDEASSVQGTGGFFDGTLRQYAVFPEQALVAAPRNLGDDFVAAATLSCAGLTAWNALYGLRPVIAGDTVLVQGTGGVSIFALQFAKAAGAVVVATTSSAAKAVKLTELGADHVINYVENPNWGEAAKSLTRGAVGFDFIVEVGGRGTFEQSLKAVRYEGIIAVVGFLGGYAGTADEGMPAIVRAHTHTCTVRGLVVGSRAQMVDMVAAIEANDIRPVVDKKVFSLEQAREAYEYLVR